MNLSTFSSKDEWKVLLVVVIALAAVELLARDRTKFFSDVARSARRSQESATLMSRPRPRILFLGNSLTEYGIQLDSFRSECEEEGFHAGGISKITADDTTLRHWHYIFESCFDGVVPSGSPDFVVIAFAENHLSDQVEPRWRRMALNVTAEQIPKVLTEDTRSFDNCAYVVAASVLVSLAHQPDLKAGLLQRIIPHYREQVLRLNQIRIATGQRQDDLMGPDDRHFTYLSLQRFIDMLSEKGTHAIFCLIPMPTEQYLDDELINTIAAGRMTLFDFRELSESIQGHFPDGYHMDEVGADRFSRSIAQRMLADIPRTMIDE